MPRSNKHLRANRGPKSRLHAGSAILAFEPLEQRRLLAAVNWTGGGDGINWTDPNNWSSAPSLPGAADDVTINIAAAPSIQLNSGNRTVNSLNNAESLTISGNATLSV